jgi:hypothetical protein
MVETSMRVTRPGRLTFSVQGLKIFVFTILIFLFVFFRFFLAHPPFSYDYNAYIFIFDTLDDLSFSEIVGEDLIFPYTIAKGIVPIEFGFALLVKAISFLGFAAETNFALIAAVSVGLRAYLMRKLGVPIIWIFAINAIAISLLEANALRLGVAASMLLWALVALRAGRRCDGLLLMAASACVHLQVIIFTAPFLLFFLLSRWVNRTKYHFAVSLAAAMSMTIFSVQLLPLLANEKVQEYVARGASTSAGVTLTSMLAAMFLVTSTYALRKRSTFGADGDFFSAILLASAPSIVMLIVLNNVAVIGDRAWQLAFLVLSTFFFTNWTSRRRKKMAFYILMALTLVMLNNIIFRYPLSNFFSPPAPPSTFQVFLDSGANALTANQRSG